MRKVELTEAGQLYYERCKRIWTKHGSPTSNWGRCCRLAMLGLGVVLLAEEVAAEDVAAGRLRRILPGRQTRPTPVYALTETRLLLAKTQRFIEFLKECLGTKA